MEPVEGSRKEEVERERGKKYCGGGGGGEEEEERKKKRERE